MATEKDQADVLAASELDDALCCLTLQKGVLRSHVHFAQAGCHLMQVSSGFCFAHVPVQRVNGAGSIIGMGVLQHSQQCGSSAEGEGQCHRMGQYALRYLRSVQGNENMLEHSTPLLS